MSCRVALPLAALALLTTAVAAQSVSPGAGTIFIGSYSGYIMAIDEATEAVTKIRLETGPPYRVRLSPDRTRFYVQSANFERFEVIDVARRQSLDTFTLSDARRHVRALAYEVDPGHRTMVLVARTATRLNDRWEIGEPEFIQYDLTSHSVVRSAPWTADFDPAGGTTLRFSPDGKLLYLFGRRVLVFDAATFGQVDSWDLSLPGESGIGRLDPGAWDESSDRQGHLTSLFTMHDDVMHRDLLVVGQVDLQAKAIDVFPLGPAPDGEGDISFSVTSDRRHAYLLQADIGHYELLTVDMTARRVESRMGIPGRPRMLIRASSSGQVLYVHEAGRTIDLHAPAGFARLKTISLDSDMMYGTFLVLPPGGAGR